MATALGRKVQENVVWVRWSGSGAINFPFGTKEIKLRVGTNKLTKKHFDSITGGIDSEGRARGGSAATYWNAERPLLQFDREPIADDPYHEGKEMPGIRPSRRTQNRDQELAELRREIAELRASASAAKDDSGEMAELRGELKELRAFYAEAKDDAEELAELRSELKELKASQAPIDPNEMTVAELAEAIKELDRPSLAQVLALEISGQNRSSAIKLLTKRIED